MCSEQRARDWVAWHEAYEDPTSSLGRRLAIVKQRLAQVVDEAATAQAQLLSLCAGDGRDVIPVLSSRSGPPIPALLVELDETLATRARDAAAAAGLDEVQVRCGDAGDPKLFEDVLPVGMLLMCGIFGNVEHSAVKKIIDAIPYLLAAGGYVIWTRGGSLPDRRPDVRRWFQDSGLDEISFDGAPDAFGVGLNRLGSNSTAGPGTLPDHLFAFV
jgi:hypothetical protein